MAAHKLRDRVSRWLESHWGLELAKCGGDRCLGRSIGSWKSGWMVGGCFPGHGHTWRRYRSLKEIAQKFEMPV